MSLTANGRMTGRAAVTHLAEEREYLREQARKASLKFDNDFAQAETDLRDMMGDKFNDWWDSYPDTLTKGEFLPIMQAKIADLQAEPVAVDLASSLEPMNNEELRQLVEYPTYDQLIAGAKFTDEHRADLHKWWNEKYSDKERGL